MVTIEPVPTRPPPAVRPRPPVTIFTDRERHRHIPPPCRVCGATTVQRWANAVTLDRDAGDPDVPQWLPVAAECPTSEHNQTEGPARGE